MMLIKKRSDGKFKCIEGTDAGEPYVILCGLTEGGDVVPLRVDVDGKVVFST